MLILAALLALVVPAPPPPAEVPTEAARPRKHSGCAIVDPQMPDTPEGRCVAAQVSLMRFPHPEVPVKVRFPLKLR